MADKLTLPAATIEAWEARYIKEVSTAAGNYTEEIARIDGLIARVEGGQVWTESGGDAAIGAMQWTDDAITATAGNTSTGTSANDKRNGVLMLGGMGVVVGLVVVFVMMPLFSGSARATPTPTGDGVAAAATFELPETVDDANLKLPLDAPRSLEVRGLAFRVLSGKVNPTGQLVYPELGSGQVVWFASPVNWLVGGPEVMVQSLVVGDVIQARTISGRVVKFVVARITDVDPQEIEALAQTRVGLTLFPLPSSTAPVRVVYARYDPTQEQPEAPEAQAALGTAVPIPGGQFVVTSGSVEQQAGGVYQVTVRGQTVAALIAPALDIGGEVYPALENLPEQGEFVAHFIVPDIGPAQFIAGDVRVDVPLTRPALTAVITAVRADGLTLDVDIVLTSVNGVAYLGAGDAALLIPVTPAQSTAGEVAPLSITPATVRVEPGQTVAATLHFAWLPGLTQARLRLLDQLYQLLIY